MAWWTVLRCSNKQLIWWNKGQFDRLLKKNRFRLRWGWSSTPGMPKPLQLKQSHAPKTATLKVPRPNWKCRSGPCRSTQYPNWDADARSTRQSCECYAFDRSFAGPFDECDYFPWSCQGFGWRLRKSRRTRKLSKKDFEKVALFYLEWNAEQGRSICDWLCPVFFNFDAWKLTFCQMQCRASAAWFVLRVNPVDYG